MDDAPVLTERRAGYRVITLNRPRYLNAFNEPMHRALRRALVDAEEDSDCRALLLTGAGAAFCAGQDLRERVTADGKTAVLGNALETYYNPLVRKLRALPIPLVAAVNGVAAGAGANIALACDIVLAARSATFLQAFAKIGLVPDCGGTWVLPRLVGPARGTARGEPFARLCRRRASVPAKAPAGLRRTQGVLGCAVQVAHDRAGNYLLRGGIRMSSASCSLLNGASINLSLTASLWIPAMSFISSVCRASLE